ncbi:MAG: site-specific DNA-methyltransferase [Bacteroidota bacterium]|nr:site-specific DNA-methyltransferase [Bacteroidota bacterium]
MKRTKLQKERSLYSKNKIVRFFSNDPVYNYSSLGKYSKSDLALAYNGKRDIHSIISEIPRATFKEITSYGQIELHTHPNILIEGNNLTALDALLNNSDVSGNVRLVYIDPPFSTNQEYRIGSDRTSTVSSSNGDILAYSDNLSGSEYLEFLRERIILLRELLSEDGSMYLHSDYKIGHYVKIIMDEIFGASNFINDITRIKCNPKNFSRKGYGNIKDMILFYSKTRNFIWNEPRVEMSEEDIIGLFPKIGKDGRRYTTNPLHAPGETKNGATGEKWNGLFPPAGRHWRVGPKELSRLERLGLIEWSKTGNPRKKIFADEVFQRGKKLQDVWELKDPPYPIYPTEKNLELLKRIITASSNVGDIVLDCFAGSGTTLVAAEELKRKWIGIDESRAAITAILKQLQKIENVTSYVHYKCTASTASHYLKSRKKQ